MCPSAEVLPCFSSGLWGEGVTWKQHLRSWGPLPFVAGCFLVFSLGPWEVAVASPRLLTVAVLPAGGRHLFHVEPG